MAEDKWVLISFKTTSTRNLDVFRQGLRFLDSVVEWRKLSSIYRVRRPSESFSSLRHIKSEELLDGFSCVGFGVAMTDPEKLIQKVRDTEESLRKEELRRSLSCNLLTYGAELLRFPELTLPHPEFHLRPEEVVPASEVWPDYVHPVLKASIREMARSFLNETWGEYHCAGEPLLAK